MTQKIMDKYQNRYFRKGDIWMEISTYKSFQNNYLFGKCKVNLQWDSITQILESLKL